MTTAKPKHTLTAHPDGLFDREAEWRDLAAFATRATEKASIGVIYGRRRQGKSFLLNHLSRAVGGFSFQALEETREAALGTFYQAVAAWTGQTALPGSRFDDWPQAFGTLAEAANGRLIVIDELPYLLRDSPELPSVIQAAYDASQSGRVPAFRLLLCGSALSVMSEVLSGTKALRGRARLDMPVQSFDFRQARSFYQIQDPLTAFLVDSVLGGPPGYRDLLDAPPASADGFEEWLFEGVLNPSHALFREADYLLTEDPKLADRALYRSIVAAVAEGNATKSGVASAISRKEDSLDFPIGQLEKAQFLIRDHDLLRPNRPLLRVADPILRFYFAVMRRDWGRFSSRQTAAAWADARARFDSQVLGPHFESMTRIWAARYASSETVGTNQRRVGFAQVNDPQEKQAFELDVVVAGLGDEARKLSAVGEAKGGEASRTMSDLRRLERLRGLLSTRADTSTTKLLLFGRSGFDADVVDLAASRSDIELVDVGRLYDGD